jgi:hypothetical protein
MSLRDVLGGIGYAVDTPGALLRGVLAGKPGQRATGRDVLRLGENKPGLDAGDVAGFLAEMVLDPVNLVGGALAVKGAKLATNALRGRAIAKGVSVARNVAAPSKLGQIVAHSVPVESVVGAAEKAPALARPVIQQSVESAKGHLGDVLSEITQSRPTADILREGVKEAGAHHFRKMSRSGIEAGQITNPHSQLQLFDDASLGRAQIEKAMQGKVLIAQSDQMPNSAAYYNQGGIWFDPKTLKVKSTAEHIGYHPIIENAEADKLRHAARHEGTHLITGPDNLSEPLKTYLRRAKDARESVDWNSVHKRGKDPRFQAKHVPAAFDNPAEEFDYLTDPHEVMARVATTRMALTKMAPHLHNRALSTPDLAHFLSPDTSDLVRAYGPRLTKHLLKVLPAVPLGAIPLAAASSQQSNQA